MLSVHSVGHVPYEGAPPIKPLTIYQKIWLFLFLTKDVLKVLIFAVLIIIQSVLTAIFPKFKKSIVGKTALITGGGNGIGRAIALELAQNGCNVVILDVDANAAATTVKDVKSYDVIGKSYIVDISDSEALKNIKQKIAEEIGPVDILINNASLVSMIPLSLQSTADIDKIINVNVKGLVWTTRLFLKDMIEKRSGHIVTIVSNSALYPIGNAIIYSAGKSFVMSFMMALQQHLRQDGYGDCIHLTSIYPYFIATRKDLVQALNLRFPPLSPEDIAKLTIDGIQRNKREVGVPNYLLKLSKIFVIVPFEIQNLVRDFVLNDKDSQAI